MADRHYDFSGWATKNNVRCADGRTIRRGAFTDCDGKTVPLVYNHSHNNIDDVLGHMLLEEREEGMYGYGWFNDSESGKKARASVENGDITALSIYANHLRQSNGDVMHGNICEVSLVLAGANPEALIDACFAHSDSAHDDEAVLFSEENIGLEMYHADAEPAAKEEPKEEKNEEKENPKMADDAKEKTLQDIFDTLNEEQKKMVYAMVGLAVEEAKGGDDDGKGEDMKHSIFEANGDDVQEVNVLSHADETAILDMAKSTACGSFRDALAIFCEKKGIDTLQHGFDPIEYLFPDFKNIPEGKPDMLTRDQEWVSEVLTGITKTPVTRIRTRQLDGRNSSLRALGYNDRTAKKKNMGLITAIKRETTPQTIYIKDELHKDDIDDITDFNVVDAEYQYMRTLLNEELAMAIMVGDQREDDDPDKIATNHIRPIWTDSEYYTIHQDIDFAGTKATVQGTGTPVSFGDNFIYAEAIIAATLNARMKYKGSGNLEYWCTPTMLNKVLLAKDMNGRRIYNSVADFAAALNVKKIVTAEQFENLTREEGEGASAKTKKLVGIFANLNDYVLGAVKNGQISKFDQFDIDYNKQKLLLETRCSGALAKLYSAIALEEEVAPTVVPEG